jgi:hypothetical protein
MTLLDVNELCAYWMDHPPVHLMAAAYLGIGSGKRPSPVRGSSPVPGLSPGMSRGPEIRGPHTAPATDLRSVLTELPPGTFVERDVHEGLPRVVLDFLELKRVSGTRR